MLLYRTRIFNFPVSFSLGTFIKHFERASILKLTATTRRTATTKSSIVNASHFETLNPLQKQQLQLYVGALLDWNQVLLLSSHIEDSLAIIPPIRSSYISNCGSSIEKLNLVDVGSGAGLPGLILAIACPDWELTLLDSLNKRCVFLEHVVGLIGLSNVKVMRGRAEYFNLMLRQDVGQNLEFREVFDVAVARAVAEMRILAEYCLPLVRVVGLFVAAKGHSPEEEVRRAKKAISLMGASLLQTCYVNSHSPYGQRTAIVCLKDGLTPRKYPRDPGTPAKSPL
ncbi:hypothetical protein L1987_66749 [Smallanthus sonchifolius]|uniref:Uncharacterized protein n=1 Tax=Smallanthus sonchifolius TaxID=185202 RepID=A0ACB9BYC9_9ASTR|nr:hypothetical protein L1987_66749 [Smallanthus sonchifolius]